MSGSHDTVSGSIAPAIIMSVIVMIAMFGSTLLDQEVPKECHWISGIVVFKVDNGTLVNDSIFEEYDFDDELWPYGITFENGSFMNWPLNDSTRYVLGIVGGTNDSSMKLLMNVQRPLWDLMETGDVYDGWACSTEKQTLREMIDNGTAQILDGEMPW